MAIFSKPVRIHCSCYELGHCWTPHCVQATTDVAQDIFSEAIKIYGALYLLTALVRRKGWKYYAKKFVPETLQSTLFLTVNGTLFISMFCIWRKLMGYYTIYDTFVCGIPACAAAVLIERAHRRLLGCFYYINSAFLPAFFTAGTAVLVERKNRRGPLAIYITNLAVETCFRMLINRGIVRPIKNGEVLLFSLASAVYLYLFKKKDGLPKPTLSFFKFLLGADEHPDSTTTKDANDNSTTTTTTTASTPSSPATPEATTAAKAASLSSSSAAVDHSGGRWWKRSMLEMLLKLPGVGQVTRTVSPLWQSVTERVRASPRHASCPHAYGCLHYVLKGLCKMFGVGYVVQLLVKLLSSMSAIRRRPREILHVLRAPGTFGLATFLGLYSAVFRGVNCSLRWLRQKDEAIHGMVAGFFAGGAMYFYNSLTIALFCSAKVVEVLYFRGIEAGRLPYIPYADIFIYAVSCAFVFHTAVMEPHALRPAYWKWLLRVTHNKFAMMNRRLIDVFGTNASKMFPDYWPDYDPKYTDLIRPPS